MSESMPGGGAERSPKITKEQVIERLKAEPTDLSPFFEWLDWRQEAAKTDEEGNDLIFEMAEIYRESGLLEAARDAFTDALDQAYHMRDTEREQRARDALDALPKLS